MAKLRTARIILLALGLGWLTAGCQSVKAPADAAGTNALRVDSQLPPRENLRRLALAESTGTPALRAGNPGSPALQAAPPSTPGSGSRATPIPPGIEPAVLAQRDPAHATAFKSLPEAVAQISAQLTLASPNAASLNVETSPEAKVRAEKHYAKARAAAKDGKHLQAILDFQKALELDPTSPRIMQELARSYVAENNATKAIELYGNLLAYEPENSEALFTVGAAAAARRDFARGVAALGRLRASGQPFTHDPAANVLGDFFLSISLRELDFDRASITAAANSLDFPQQIERPTQLLPHLDSVYRQRGDTWRSIGDAHCRLGEFAQAREAYAKAVALPLADPAAMTPRLIFVNLALGRVHSAQWALLCGLQGHPEHAVVETANALEGPIDQQSPSLIAVSDRDIRLCAYIRENARPLDWLAAAVGEMFRANPDEGSLARAAASLQTSGAALELLKEFVNRRPRDLETVGQMLAWLAEQDIGAASALAIALATDNPDLTDEYAERLTIAVPRTSALLDALRKQEPSPAASLIQMHLLASVDALGEAWSICEQARANRSDNQWLILQRVQLAAMLREPKLFDAALGEVRGVSDSPGLIALAKAQRTMGSAENTELAIRTAQLASDRDPQNVDALIELSTAYLAHAMALAGVESRHDQVRPQLEKAIRFAEFAVDMDPQRQEGYEILTQLYAPGGALADTNLFRQIRQRLRTAHQNGPPSALAARLEAQDIIVQRRYEQAIERLMTLYDGDPSDIASLALAVTAWEQWGRLDAAVRWLNDKLQQRPGDRHLLEQLARAHLRQNQPAQAVARLQDELIASPNDPAIERLLENLYRATGNIEAAFALGLKRLQARPPGIRRELELAALYAGADSHTRAFTHLEAFAAEVTRSAASSAPTSTAPQARRANASLDDLSSAISIANRLKGDDARRNALALRLVEHAIAQYPNAPLQIYGAGMRALARMNGANSAAASLDDRFDQLAIRACESESAGETAAQQLRQWQELAQALAGDGHPAAAARALRVRLQTAQAMENQHRATLVRMILIADAGTEISSSAARLGNSAAEQSIALLREVHGEPALASALDLLGRGGGAGRPVAGAIHGGALSQMMLEVSSLYTLLGAQRGAARLLQETIDLDPHLGIAFNNLGYLFLETQHDSSVHGNNRPPIDRIIELIEYAHRLLPEDSNVLDTLGWLRYKQAHFAAAPDGEAETGALGLIQSSIRATPAGRPSEEVLDHLGDTHWRLGEKTAAIEAWKQAVSQLEEPNFQQRVAQSYLLLQSQVWQLLVVDPRVLYDLHHGQVLERVRAKLAAVEQGSEPRVAQTFDELRAKE